MLKYSRDVNEEIQRRLARETSAGGGSWRSRAKTIKRHVVCNPFSMPPSHFYFCFVLSRAPADLPWPRDRATPAPQTRSKYIIVAIWREIFVGVPRRVARPRDYGTQHRLYSRSVCFCRPDQCVGCSSGQAGILLNLLGGRVYLDRNLETNTMITYL